MAARIAPLFNAIESRKSIYALANKLPQGMSEDRLTNLILFTIKHVPSPFNVQSARAVILFGAEHEKLWDIGDELTKKTFPPAVYENVMKAKVAGYKAGYGSVLWFEDQVVLDELAAKQPALTGVIPQWSEHSSGMHQFAAWCALEAEGLGANLQHFNFNPEFNARVAEAYNLPKTWSLKAQLVFGLPTNGGERARERTYQPVEDRVKVFGAKI